MGMVLADEIILVGLSFEGTNMMIFRCCFEARLAAIGQSQANLKRDLAVNIRTTGL